MDMEFERPIFIRGVAVGMSRGSEVAPESLVPLMPGTVVGSLPCWIVDNLEGAGGADEAAGWCFPRDEAMGGVGVLLLEALRPSLRRLGTAGECGFPSRWLVERTTSELDMLSASCVWLSWTFWNLAKGLTVDAGRCVLRSEEPGEEEADVLVLV